MDRRIYACVISIIAFLSLTAQAVPQTELSRIAGNLPPEASADLILKLLGRPDWVVSSGDPEWGSDAAKNTTLVWRNGTCPLVMIEIDLPRSVMTGIDAGFGSCDETVQVRGTPPAKYLCSKSPKEPFCESKH